MDNSLSMNLPQSRPLRLRVSSWLPSVVVVSIAWILFSAIATAQDTGSANSDALRMRVESGLEGRWKVGFPTWHRIELSANTDLTGTIEVQTVDGDGNGVVYSDPAWSFQIASEVIRKDVDFPAPFGPSRPTISPDPTRNETPWTTLRRP